MILLDTSGLLAAIDRSQNQHAKAAAALRQASGPLLMSPFVLAELDYLLATRVSAEAQHALQQEVARGAYRLEPFSAEDVASAAVILGRNRDLGIGLADASIVVLGERYGVPDELTLDHRHFQALRGPGGRCFGYAPQLEPFTTARSRNVDAHCDLRRTALCDFRTAAHVTNRGKW